MFVDIHNPRMEGFFTYPSSRPLPMLNVQPHQLAVQYLKKKDLVNPVVRSPGRRLCRKICSCVCAAYGKRPRGLLPPSVFSSY